MAKYTVNYTCGHSDSVNLVGPEKDRAKKIAWMQQADCPVCRAKAEAAKNGAVEEVEMKYSEYKNNHADAKTKPNSYNAKTKTVVVYVPVAGEQPAEAEEAVEVVAEAVANVEETIQDAVKTFKASMESKEAPGAAKAEACAIMDKVAETLIDRYKSGNVALLDWQSVARQIDDLARNGNGSTTIDFADHKQDAAYGALAKIISEM